MPRILAMLVLAVALAACGGEATPAGPGGSGGGQGAVTNGAVPAGSTVAFGSAYDPTTYAVADKSTKAKVGAPLVAVGKALAPVDGSGVKIEIKLNGKAKPLRAPDVIDNPASASFFATDLTADALTPGTWIISYINPNNRVLASGFLTVTP
jgi:hypothetical protein